MINKKIIGRCLSYIIDIMIINSFSVLIWRNIPESLGIIHSDSVFVFMIKVFMILLIEIMICVVYSVACYYFFSGSFGKIIMRVNIRGDKNQKCSLKQITYHEYTKWSLFFCTFGLYAVYCFFGIIFGKRLYHEQLSNTYIK